VIDTGHFYRVIDMPERIFERRAALCPGGCQVREMLFSGKFVQGFRILRRLGRGLRGDFLP